ncbi:hypothetical protein D3C73_1203730 [compost metagenome]
MVEDNRGVRPRRRAKRTRLPNVPDRTEIGATDAVTAVERRAAGVAVIVVGQPDDRGVIVRCCNVDVTVPADERRADARAGDSKRAAIADDHGTSSVRTFDSKPHGPAGGREYAVRSRPQGGVAGRIDPAVQNGDIAAERVRARKPKTSRPRLGESCGAGNDGPDGRYAGCVRVCGNGRGDAAQGERTAGERIAGCVEGQIMYGDRRAHRNRPRRPAKNGVVES